MNRLLSSLAAVAIPLGSPALPVDREAPIIRAGDRVRIVFEAGPIHVERQALAIQSARSGQRLFVKTDQGEIFAVRAEVTQ